MVTRDISAMNKILLVGDSISLHYGPYLSNYLNEKAELHTKEGRQLAFSDLDHPVGGNGGDSHMVLSYLSERDVKDDLDFDLFIFNCGLHDIKRLGDGDWQIVQLMAKRQLKTVFITSTPIDDEKHNARKQLGFTRYNKDVCRYNQIAGEVMRAHEISLIDLGRFTAGLDDELFVDHAHFQEHVRKLQASYIAGALSAYMEPYMR